jgi:hypothetical protein
VEPGSVGPVDLKLTVIADYAALALANFTWEQTPTVVTFKT